MSGDMSERQVGLGLTSMRERQILDLIARGHSNIEIAQQLVLSPKTVSNNVSNVLAKVQAADRAELLLMALEAGLGKARQPHQP